MSMKCPNCGGRVTKHVEVKGDRAFETGVCVGTAGEDAECGWTDTVEVEKTELKRPA
jgi:hypothetical protein